MEWLTQQYGLLTAILSFDTSLLTRPDMMVRLALQAVLFAASAFFSSSETALFSLSRLDLQKLRRDEHAQSDNLHALLDEPRRLIISILCGNEVVNIAATANLTGIMVTLYGVERAGWISFVVMFPLLLLLGEITPKTIAVSDPVRISAGLISAPMNIWIRLITPLRRLVRSVSDIITTWIVGEERARENLLQIDEFRTLVEDVETEGILDATERILIDNLLESSETEIVEIMTPRTVIKYLSDTDSISEIVEAVRRYEHPRVPVFSDHRDNVVGFIHAEDIMKLILEGVDFESVNLTEILHPPIVVPPTKNVDEMFDFFQDNDVRAAMVLNEFGGIDGMVTIRDVLNFIFGEVVGSTPEQDYYRERDNNVYVVPGQMKLSAFNDLTNFGVDDPRMTTIGGVAFRHLDRLPTVGDEVAIDGLTASILEMDGHCIAKLQVARGKVDEGTEFNQLPTSEDSIPETQPLAEKTHAGQMGRTEPSSAPDVVSLDEPTKSSDGANNTGNNAAGSEVQ